MYKRLGKNQKRIVNELSDISVNLILCTDIKNHAEISKHFCKKLDELKNLIRNCESFRFEFQFNDKYFAYPVKVSALNINKEIIKEISLF